MIVTTCGENYYNGKTVTVTVTKTSKYCEGSHAKIQNALLISFKRVEKQVRTVSWAET